jgi:hypothetical protein
MKQIKKITGANIVNVMRAVNSTLDIMGGHTVESWTLQGGILMVDGDKGMTIYTEAGDVFATPDWALDWADGEWSGVSANGQSFTIADCEPMVEAE